VKRVTDAGEEVPIANPIGKRRSLAKGNVSRGSLKPQRGGKSEPRSGGGGNWRKAVRKKNDLGGVTWGVSVQRQRKKLRKKTVRFETKKCVTKGNQGGQGRKMRLKEAQGCRKGKPPGATGNAVSKKEQRVSFERDVTGGRVRSIGLT